jgi:hypothetical protein
VSSRFRRHHDGSVSLTLDPHETGLLRHLVDEFLDLIGDGDVQGDDPLSALIGLGPSEAPTDPALARLLPDAYRGDPEAAAEFRRFTEHDLREHKRSAATTVLATLGQGARLHLDGEQAHAWLGTLNDLRLALGTRLEVTEDYEQMVDALSDDDPRRPVFAIYEWLAWLQETLIRALR